MFFAEYEVDEYMQRYGSDQTPLGEAVRALASLVEWTNHNSDGWPYWQPPGKAAASLGRLIRPGWNPYSGGPHPEVTPAQLARALAPVKAFRTKCQRASADRPVYGMREPAEWFDLTDAERAATAVKAARKADAAREVKLTALADRFAPVLDEYAFRVRNGVGTDVPGSRTRDVARKLAELVNPDHRAIIADLERDPEVKAAHDAIRAVFGNDSGRA